jgi:hypothetical protein
LEEREYAKSLDMSGVEMKSKEKDALLRSFHAVKEVSEEDLLLIEKIKEENRRNAYLFWSSLKFIKDTMSFFTSQVSSASYCKSGTVVNVLSGGRLLSGKV